MGYMFYGPRGFPGDAITKFVFNPEKSVTAFKFLRHKAFAALET